MRTKKLITGFSRRKFSGAGRGAAKVFIAAFMAAALFSGCSQDEGSELDGGDLVAVNFTATVDGVALPTAKSAGTRSGVHNFTDTTDAGVPYRDYTDADGFQTRAFYPGTTGSEAGCANAPATRTTGGGDEWVQGDKVGIFMLTEGGSFTPPDDDVLADNVQYEATPDDSQTSSASFSPVNESETIYYPQTGDVYFIAYYPYDITGSITTDYKYNITVTDQSNPAVLDVLYAKSEDAAKSGMPVVLAFRHVLSKITLNVKLGTGFAEGDDVAVTSIKFSGMPQEATLNLQGGTLSADLAEAGDFFALKAETPNGDADATFTALLVPQLEIDTDRTAIFTVNGATYTWTIPEDHNFAASKHYTYLVTVNKTEFTVGAPTINGWGTGEDHESGTTEMLTMVKIPKGDFQMGSLDGNSDEKPQHEVKLTQDFYMSKYEITNDQYAAFLNAKGIGSDGKGFVTYYKTDFTTPVTEEQVFISSSYAKVANNGTAWEALDSYGNHPMIRVTWYGAKAYADWIGGSLPTEAQWEYACRAKTTTAFYWGDDAGQYDDYGWFLRNSGSTQPVGQKLPNAYGLYDMHGNVWEWCLDWIGYYGNTGVTNPLGPTSGTQRVLRGGSWDFNTLRSAYRNYDYPDDRGAYADTGFRVVFVP